LGGYSKTPFFLGAPGRRGSVRKKKPPFQGPPAPTGGGLFTGEKIRGGGEGLGNPTWEGGKFGQGQKGGG